MDEMTLAMDRSMPQPQRHNPTGKPVIAALVGKAGWVLSAFVTTIGCVGCGFILTTRTATAQDKTQWQPRPLALPATGQNGYHWTPPPAPTFPAGKPDPAVIIQSVAASPPNAAVEPQAEPTPAEIRQWRVAEKRAEARKDAQRADLQRSNQWLPPSDQINVGSRKSQLAREAVEQLRVANWAAQRGAIASAHAAATQTLQTIAALRDTQVGSNEFAERLDESFTAIRESMDFAGRYGPVDTAAIDRLIEVHQTPVLKSISTSHLTAARAVEAYLAFAQSRLVEATRGGPLAAEAAMILADLESLIGNGTVEMPTEKSSLHSAELALMYRRAAVEIAPENPDAAAELGRTLLKRSIPGAAKTYLLSSVQVRPTRQRVEALMQAAAMSGDFVLVNRCEQELATVSLPSELPIQVISPQEFARTGQTFAGNASFPTSGQAVYQIGANYPDANAVSTPDRSLPTTGQLLDRPSAPPTPNHIVDPTLPSSTPGNQRGGRLFW